MNSNTSVQVINCGKTFEDGTQALQPINLEIKGGETLVLLGPSGCGKTTLLRIIAGLETLDAGGQVLFNGEDVSHLPVEKRNIGMVFQSYALFPNMTVRDNIGYGLKVRRQSLADRQTRIQEMLAMMHIENLAERQISQLSGGQRQRVALARAIAVRPKVLLLDEPLTALDALLRERLRVEIDTLLRSLGITAIYVTHDQSEAMALADRIVVMSNGRIAQQGTPREIYQQPSNSFVADFIGTANKINGRMTDQGFEVEGVVLPKSILNVVGGNSTSANPIQTQAIFRPEDTEIVSQDQAHFNGQVASTFFMGDRTRLLVDGISESPIIVETTFKQEISIGTEISIRIKDQGLMLLPDELIEDLPKEIVEKTEQ